MTTTYRTAACPHCADPLAAASVASPSSYDRSREVASPCAACVRRAIDVVHHAFPAAQPVERRGDRRSYRRWVALAAAATLGLVFALGFGGGVAVTNLVVDRTPRLGMRTLRRVVGGRPVPAVALAAASPVAALAQPAAPAAVPVASAEPPARPSVPPLPWPAAMLADAGAPSNDPLELRARARRLINAGVDLTVIHTQLSSSAARELVTPVSWLHTRVRAVPVAHEGALYGVRIEGLEPGCALAVAGVAEGDVVTAINGRPPLHSGAVAAGSAGRRRVPAMVVELVRGGRRVVLSVAWLANEV